MASPWGKVGVWAEDVERADEEAKQKSQEKAAEPSDFPSLAAATAAPKPKKKSKGQTLSLTELHTGQAIGRGVAKGAIVDSKGLTTDEMMSLPKGPRERNADDPEDTGRWSRSLRGGDRNEGSRRGYGGFNDDERRSSRGPGGGSFSDMPSRADEAENWGSSKNPMAPSSGSFRSRYDSGDRSGDRDRFDGGVSRADEDDNWGNAKKFTPSAPLSDRRSMGFGGGYRETSSRWPNEGFGSSAQPVASERRRLSLKPRTASETAINSGSDSDAAPTQPQSNKPSPFGDARPREMVLAEKTKSENGDEIKNDSRPTSADSSRDGNTSQSEFVPKPRPKFNPFGDAKPREEILKDRGVDYRKVDMELYGPGSRNETDEEVKLKEEISRLKDLIKHVAPEESVENEDPASEANQMALTEELAEKEKQLEMLKKDLNEKAQLEKAVERPGSGAGRGFDGWERPSSQSGRSETRGSFDSLDNRPRSRGNGSRGAADVWTVQGEERRGGAFGGRNSNFGGRDRDDSRRGGRW